jgi:hypothetical protein
MSAPYSIYAGASNLGTLDALRCSRALVTTTAQGNDLMELTVSRDIAAAMPFTPLARHKLVDSEGDTRFVGWLLEPPRRAAGSRHEHIYRFSGPWATFLDRTIFRQTSQFPVHEEGEEPTTMPLSLILLNYRIGTGGVGIKAQIEEALDYAKDACGDLFNYNTTALPTVIPPADEQADRTVSEIVRSQMRWCPGVSCYWNYPTDGGVPVLTFVAAPTTKTIDIQDTNVTGFIGHPRYDLLIPKVRLEYLTEISEVAAPTEEEPDATAKIWTLIGVDESTEANGAFGAVEHTVVLLKYNGTLQDAPVGLAAQLHAPYKTLSTELAWQRHGAEVDWVDHPAAAKWNVTGAGSAFTASEGVCQAIVRDLHTGTVAYKCGPPSHLGLNDLLALLRINRKRSSNNQSDGFEGSSEGEGEGDGELEEVTGAVNGVPSTLQVMTDGNGWTAI